jgi:twitching motility protein PilJ
MAFLDSLRNVFKKRTGDSELDSGLSLGLPDDSMFGDISSIDPHMSQHMASDKVTALSKPQASPISTPESALTLDNADQVVLPVLGRRSVPAHQRMLSVMLGLALVVLVIISLVSLHQSDSTVRQLGASGQALMQSQRLAKSVSRAVVGDTKAFPELADSMQILSRSVRGLLNGDPQQGLEVLGASDQAVVGQAAASEELTEKSAASLMVQQKLLIQAGAVLRLVNRQSAHWLQIAQSLLTLKLQQNLSAPEISASAQLLMLTQRMAKLSNELLTADGGGPDVVVLLANDLKSFKEISLGLLDGSTELRLAGSRDVASREQLAALVKSFDETMAQSGSALTDLQVMVLARASQVAILKSTDILRQELEVLSQMLSTRSGFSMVHLAVMVLSAALALLSALGLSYVQLQDSRQRQLGADTQRQQAQHRELEAKRINDANQAAILRLMNELQTLSEGDLTQQATVTEDITGAIADSVNYTVEELRSLVGNVQSSAAKVAKTTSEVDMTSTELLAASKEQLHEIRETGRSVLDMATRINQVSTQAQESADVARQSLKAAEVGSQAVQNAIGGMNAIRDQIQDTSKRLKRLGESSQEIGEITELISDITEQTNVLALNAAIQAASAGDAGRGFSVVAEEVQRLAERSADATRQIAALVKAIQTDTHDAVGAMERSTQGVVEGARLSDNAGTALTEIDQVSRRLAELIEQISESTVREANMANEVAGNIQHIFAVTEQTSEGTRSTSEQVRELSKVAEELRQSVARFRIA